MSLHPDSKKAIDRIKKSWKNKRIVFVPGNFNIIHPGHLRLLRFAKGFGDVLVVGVLDSSSEGAHVEENLRVDGVKAISWVDFTFLMHDKPEEIVRQLQPAFVVKGKEWENKNNPESSIIEEYGGKLVFGSGEISFSSVDLIKLELASAAPPVISKTTDFPLRHTFSQGDLLDTLEKFRHLRVCVFGDAIVDEYISCEPLGLSQEDPTIVVTPLLQNRFVGGAAIVSAHAQGLGGKVHFFSVVGEDQTADWLRDALESQGVKTHLYPDKSRPTTLKQRFRVAQKTLLRVSHLRQHSIAMEIRETILQDFLRVIPEIDLVIFSDFNYGCLPQSLVDPLIEECLKRRIPMVGDSQTSSQIGDVSRFHDMQLLTPTEREARVAFHDNESGLVILAEKLRSQANAQNVIITLGSEGILIHANIGKSHPLTDRLPAFNTAPKDPAGAGDSFLCCTSMALAVGADIWRSAYLGSLGAGCQVGRMGNVPLTSEELAAEIRRT